MSHSAGICVHGMSSLIIFRASTRWDGSPLRRLHSLCTQFSPQQSHSCVLLRLGPVTCFAVRFGLVPRPYYELWKPTYKLVVIFSLMEYIRLARIA
jgi:hypothetical protein